MRQTLRKFYAGIAKRIRRLPIWRLQVGPYDVGDLVDSLVWRIIPPERNERQVSLVWGDRLKFPPGYRCYLSDPYVYEPATTEAFSSILGPGMGFVDGGAHLGYFTLLAAHLVGDSGRVFSFEPDPLYFEWLLQNIQTNACGSIEAFSLALGERIAEATLFRQPGDMGGSLHRRRPIRCEAVLVRVVPLDEVMNALGWPRIDLVKLDIEGNETSALRGTPETIRKNPHVRVIVEFETRAMRAAGVRPIEFVGTLRSLGFKRYWALTSDRQIEIELPERVEMLGSLAASELYVNLLCEPE